MLDRIVVRASEMATRLRYVLPRAQGQFLHRKQHQHSCVLGFSTAGIRPTLFTPNSPKRWVATCSLVSGGEMHYMHTLALT